MRIETSSRSPSSDARLKGVRGVGISWGAPPPPRPSRSGLC